MEGDRRPVGASRMMGEEMESFVTDCVSSAIILTMPNCLLVCESCGSRQTVFLEDAVAGEIRNGKTLPKHCLRCHGTTAWAFLFLDRRGGQERRGGSDRRDNPSSGKEPQ